MLRNTAIAIGVLSAFTVSIAANSQEKKEWITNHFHESNEEAAEWVTSKCGPSDISGIHGAVVQSTAGNWDVHIFCRVDKSGTVWKPSTVGTEAGWDKGLAARLQLGKAVLVGNVTGTKPTILVLEKQ